MTHPPAAPNYVEQQAGALQSGDHLLLPDGSRSAEIRRVDVENDDFGTPAVVLATLTGGWDFTLSWTPRAAFENPARPSDGAALPLDPTGSLTVFEALEKQLGLRIQKGTHEIPVTVVEHLDEKPSDR